MFPNCTVIVFCVYILYRYIAMSVYEEKQLLRQLKSCSTIIDNIAKANRLKRKLYVRQVRHLYQYSAFNRY